MIELTQIDHRLLVASVERPFLDEDHAFKVYARGRSRAGVSGVDPIAMRGIEWAKICPVCHGDRWVEQDGVQRCGAFRCGAPRPSKMIGVTRGFFQENTRRHSGNYRLERQADLGMVFRVLLVWEFRAWWTYVALGSYRRSFHFCRQHYHRRTAGWSLHQVKRLCGDARDRTRPRLEQRGLIP